MSDTTTHDTNVALTEKAGTLLDYFQGHRDALEADRVTNNQLVAQAVADLPAVVSNVMQFTADWRPSQPDNKVEHGSFQNLIELIYTAPRGALVYVKMYNDEIYNLDYTATAQGRFVFFVGQNGWVDADRPVLNIPSQDDGTYSRLIGQVDLVLGGEVRFKEVNVSLGAKGVSPWSSTKSFIRVNAADGGMAKASFRTCKVIGSDNAGIIRTHVGGIVAVSSYGLTLDGAISIVPDAANGISLLSNQSLGLLNGATTHVGGVVGQNVLLG